MKIQYYFIFFLFNFVCMFLTIEKEKKEIFAYTQDDYADSNYGANYQKETEYQKNENLNQNIPIEIEEERKRNSPQSNENYYSYEQNEAKANSYNPTPSFSSSRESSSQEQSFQDHQFYNPTPLYNKKKEGDTNILLDPNQNDSRINSFQVQDDTRNHLLKKKDLSLRIDPKKDIYWEFGANGNYIDLIIRKKPKIESVLLTNMYYGKKFTEIYGDKVYGLRSKESFGINQAEKRVINNKVVSNQEGLNFLLSSTPVKNAIFQQAFRIRLPLQVEYGYKTSGENYGVIFIKKGVFINLRTFEKKYANHQSAFENNPIEIDFSEKDYINRMKPRIEKLAVFHSNGFKIIKIRYFSRFEYIKNFLLRDIHKSQFFRKIPFASEPFKNETSLVIRAMNNPKVGINMIALIYIREENFEKDYEISAIDQENRTAQNIIHFTNNPSLNKIYKNFKENQHKQSREEFLKNFSTSERELRSRSIY